jgi:sulfate adenylyltransferase
MILPPAHGGQLKQLLVAELPSDLDRLPFLKLTPRQQCDVEMLLTGAFSPLEGFLGRDDYLAVLQDARLADGTLWPLPVMLDVDSATLDAIKSEDRLLLLDAELYPVAVLELRDAWQPDRAREAKTLYGTDSVGHDGARHVLHETASHYVSGRLRGIRLPACRFQSRYRATPATQRAALDDGASRGAMGWFAPGPPGSEQVENLAAQLAACKADHLLVMHSAHATPVGAPPPRVAAQCIEALLPRLAARSRVSYCSIALWPRWSGARETVAQAIVCQNYGAGHYLVAGNHAVTRAGTGQLPPAMRFDQELLKRAQRELAVRFVAATGRPAATDTTLPEVSEILRRHEMRRTARGCALLLTGLSGAGKSSLVHALGERLEALLGRAVTVLDGDYSRQLLTSGLAATPADQVTNVLRHAYIAAEVVRHGGIALIALVAPDAAARAAARRMVEPHGGFIEVYLSASAAACEARDVKGIYARVKGGTLGAVANIAECYEVPSHPDIVADSARRDTAALVEQIVGELEARGYLKR